MRNERDELATTIHRRICEESLAECLEDEGYCVKAAVAVIASGYRKPRVIEDAYSDDGPDALQPLSVVLSGGKPAIRQYDHTFMDYDGSSWDDWEMEYPMTVLYEPEAGK